MSGCLQLRLNMRHFATCGPSKFDNYDVTPHREVSSLECGNLPYCWLFYHAAVFSSDGESGGQPTQGSACTLAQVASVAQIYVNYASLNKSIACSKPIVHAVWSGVEAQQYSRLDEYEAHARRCCNGVGFAVALHVIYQ